MSSQGSKLRLGNSTTISSSANVSFALRGSAGPNESQWLLTVSAIWRRFLRSACNGPQAGDSTLSKLGARLEFAALFGLNHEDVLP